MRHRIARKSKLVTGGVILMAMSVLGAMTALASHSFNDVPDDHTFHNAIEWMKDSGITVGCNPPANTEYCPGEFTTRGQMAAFFARFAKAGVVDADTLDGRDSADFVQKSELDELNGVPGPQGPQGIQGPAGGISESNVTLREASQGTGLVVAGNSYTTMCEPGEIAIGGGYEADFTLVDLEGVELPIIGDLLGLEIDLGDLDAALDGVANVSISASGPTQDGSLWGWQIQATADIASDITVQAICAS